MNEKIIESLVKNFTWNISIRLLLLILSTSLCFHYAITPFWMTAPLVLIVAFHLVELHFVNQSFQAHFNNDQKFVMVTKVIDYISLTMSIIYLITIAVLAVL